MHTYLGNMHMLLCHGFESHELENQFSVSSELHFLPHLLNINDTRNNARKGPGGAHDIISGCGGGGGGDQFGSLN